MTVTKKQNKRAAYYFPVNTSGRSKEDIVKDMENTELAAFIIETDTGVHLDACRCRKCFQRKLDALMTQSEVTTNDIRTNFIGDANSNFVSADSTANKSGLPK